MEGLLFLLVTIFLLAGVSLHLSLTLNGKQQFDQLVRFFLVFVMVHALHALLVRLTPPEYAYIDRAAPFGLLYGPLLYFAFLANQSVLQKKTIMVHGAPFLIGFVCYLLYLSIPVFREFSRYYYSVLYGLMALSWLVYPTIVYLKGTSNKQRTTNQQEDKTWVALIILLVLSFCMLILVPTRIVHGEKSSMSTGFLIFSAMFAAIFYVYLFNIRTLKALLKKGNDVTEPMPANEVEKADDSSYQKSIVQDEVMSIYLHKVDGFLKSKHYLEPSLSVDTLSSKLKIPKHHVSQLFSQCYGESFVKHINTLRIQHACELLSTADFDSNIDQLYEQCGFSSRASFYRNFKTKMGMTPLEFLEEAKIIEIG